MQNEELKYFLEEENDKLEIYRAGFIDGREDKESSERFYKERSNSYFYEILSLKKEIELLKEKLAVKPVRVPLYYTSKKDVYSDVVNGFVLHWKNDCYTLVRNGIDILITDPTGWLVGCLSDEDVKPEEIFHIKEV